MGMDARFVRGAKTLARRGLRPRRAQSVSNLREIRDVLRARRSDAGEGDGIGNTSCYENDAS